jgi:hypothetical protein
MKRFLLASAALVALTGVAYAQEAPYLSGNYSASVVNNHSAANRGARSTYVIRDYDNGPQVYYRDYDRPRYVYREQFRPRYMARDYYWDDYYAPRYYRPRAGVSLSIGGPSWGVGVYDY